MLNRRLASFLPHVYDGILEMSSIVDAEDNIMDTFRTEMSTAFYNTFVLTADEDGIYMFEKMLNIIADPYKEDLEFRRQRLLNRVSMTPPFTFRFLKQKLDDVIGKGSWTAYIDFDKYSIYVESSAENQNWYSEIEFTLNRIKPCNMVFVTVPRVSRKMFMNEVISYETLHWKYRLGSWKLGEHPFAIRDIGGVLKLATTESIKPVLLNGAATFVHDKIAYVLINDSVTVNEFDTKQVSNNVVSIEYSVSPENTSIITNIKLMSSNNEVLTEADVYVPVQQTVISKHIITVQEGT